MLPRETRLTPFLRSLALILGFLVGSAALAAEAVFPPGSRIGLEPLAGMVPSKRFTGFEDAGQGVAFTFVEMASDAYREIASGLTAERLKNQGIELRTREELKLGDRNAVLVAGEQKLGELTLRKWFLVVEDPSLTALVIGQALPEAQSRPGGAIKAAPSSRSRSSPSRRRRRRRRSSARPSRARRCSRTRSSGMRRSSARRASGRRAPNGTRSSPGRPRSPPARRSSSPRPSA